MPSLQIRKLPNNLYDALKKAAERERRSMSQQAIIALAKGLNLPVDFLERRKKILSTCKKEADAWKKWENVDVTAWIREDRDRR